MQKNKLLSKNSRYTSKGSLAFDIIALRQMVLGGALKRDSLVWKAGMSDWVRADSIPELDDLFAVPPAVPQSNE